MFNLRSWTVVLSGLSALSQALQLQDLPPPAKPGTLSRRDGFSMMDLQSHETFIWGGTNNDNVVLGNLTVHMTDDQENILSMEKFKGMLASVSCTNSTMDLSFKNAQAFHYAQGVWDWVNGAENHTFVMVAGTGDCGWNTHRVPFTVFEMTYDNSTYSAHLTANASSWASAIHTYSLDVGSLPQDSNTVPDLEKRADYDKDLTLDFNHQFPINTTSLSAGPYGVTLSCTSCGTYGQFVFSFHLETELLVPKEVTVGLQPQDVSMEIEPKITLSGNIIPSKTFEMHLLTIPIDGIAIPGGILDLGPTIVFNAGVTVGPLQGSAGISAGLNLAIPNNASATLDILNASFDQSGWDPIVTTSDVVLDARLSGGVRAFVNGEVELALEALEVGYDVGVTLGPYIQGKLEAIASTGAACSNDPEKRHFGVDFNPTYGVALTAVLEDAQGDAVLKSEIDAWVQQLPIVCFPFGDEGNVTATTTIVGDAPPPTATLTTILTGTAASAVMASETAS